MKKAIIILGLVVAMLVPAILAGCDDEVQVHQERTLAPRTVHQSEVVTPD
ncbi:MAG TPA: hypothetical protein PKK48_04575 [Phycisphaerae bacterium]|nr:hypothetical protein [Phycisphaerae bacterium]HPS53407.1 hypothetical protein [Phycisphaerae bacterium]